MKISRSIMLSALIVLCGGAIGFGMGSSSLTGACLPEANGALEISVVNSPPQFKCTADIDCPDLGDVCCVEWRILVLKWSVREGTWVRAQDLSGTSSDYDCLTLRQPMLIFSDQVGTGTFQVTFYIISCADGTIIDQVSDEFTL